MRRRMLVILGSVTALFLAALLILHSYRLELIETVVVNAMVQKAPPQREAEIRQTFASAHRAAVENNAVDEYLQQLFAVSQELERTQSIEGDGVDQVLEPISAWARSAAPKTPR